MKKIFIIVSLAIVATNINAQLVVDSLGRVGIGTETSLSLISVGGGGDELNSIYCKLDDYDDSIIGFFLRKHSDTVDGIFGSQWSAQNTIGTSCGILSSAKGGNNSDSSQKAVGVIGMAGRSYTSVGLLGGKWLWNDNTVNFAGVYGTETFEILPSFTNYTGTYAGYFKGKVRVTNGIYATVLSPTASASPSGQSSTVVLSERGESVTDKLSQVQALQSLRYDSPKESNTPIIQLGDADLDNMSLREIDYLAREVGEVEPERYLSPIQYGLDAEQLKAVYPELVYEDANGNVSINYVEMIPLLVQSINELKNEIAELKGTSPRGAKAQADATAIEENVSDIDMVRMDQNKPNPFSESTVISLNIPDKAQTASIFIYDMSGKQVQSIPVSERGETNITVYASDLSAGMYIYTLVVDGKVSVTRRMIVSMV